MENKKQHRGWPDSNELPPVEWEINRHIGRLDDVAREYEAKWGIGRLPDLVSPQMYIKWELQLQKLNAAVQANDLQMVTDLIEGTIRGWAVLEAEALASGQHPIDPEYWEYETEDGFKLRVCRDIGSARALAGRQDVAEGYVIFSLGEVANLIESQYRAVYDVKRAIPGSEVTNVAFNFEEGDEVGI